MRKLDITVLGAGIYGLWQTLELARRGHRVRLLEESAQPFAAAERRLACAMLSPYCEEEGAEPIIADLGLDAIKLWRATFPGLVSNGTLVVAGARDRAEIVRFSRMTRCHTQVDADAIAALEPDLAGRFATGLHFATEAHMAPVDAMSTLLQAGRKAGAQVHFGVASDGTETTQDRIVDCRGLGSRAMLPHLRAVRGERVLIRSRDVTLARAVRLLHPRHPLYVVPWPDNAFMVGATVIESEDPSPMTVRSALELLGLAYALHPGFGEAEIVEFAAGLRPALPDNVPRIITTRDRIHVNGAYRHGFLLAPVLARISADFIESGIRDTEMIIDG